MLIDIPSGFLPPEAPHNVKSEIIDFMSTDPAIPEYEDSFAAIIDNFMTEDECNELLALAVTPSSDNPNISSTEDGPWERAMINTGNEEQAMATEFRNCGRMIFESPELADRLLTRLMPFFKQWEMTNLRGQLNVTGLSGRKNEYTLSRLNEQLRFLKYVGGEYFRPHYDGEYRTPDGSEVSFFTIHLYLNGEGEDGQDLKEVLKRKELEDKNEVFKIAAGEENGKGKLLGGATSFMGSWVNNDKAVRVWPKTGRVLVFQQSDLLHSGDSVYSGTKFTVRTDVMYKKTPWSQT
ncbi:hypothetical protein BGW36DRAFT_389327 [Talaromyces proteolyticus]|uniref:Prolyl 4-hydroxylase alpha subunit domain-containing protein n=1 Tax=Talaromyces proteolyticus TaxID=1131652 RepID=A0AAD4PVK0_9EURO|nr:uncharacterized protein BGW36DRAFT_389327 [Talaromyces proteolyticus]KAH8690788.1 hypothetical protein BGW36DRAFT_389327 [Talaromyces proteolyticus]